MYRAVFIVFAAVFCIAADQTSADAIFRHALELHRSGDLDGAIREYRAYLKLRPSAVDARSNLGAALVRTGHFEEAIAEYKAALDRDAVNPGISLNLALAYYKSGRIAEAASELSILRALQPDDKRVVLLLADCWLRLGQNAKAVELLTPVEQKDPSDLAVAYVLGTALIRSGQQAQGAPLIDKILRNGDSAEARMLMGATKMQAMDYSGALQDLRRAVELNPNLPEVHSYYAQALMMTGDTPGAMTAYREELKQNPNDFNSNLNLGSLLWQEDQDYTGAFACLERALRARPGDIGARYQRANVLMATGKTDDAVRELQEIVKAAPKFTEAHVSLTTAYYRLKRKADGDRERAVVQQLNAEAQAKQPGVAAK